MAKKTVEERVKDIIADKLGNRARNLTNETSFINDLGMDSLDTVELMAVFEKEFGIEISDRAVESLKTVGQLVDHLKGRVADDA